ncbi:type IV pilin protein [Variovorax sp. J22R115]|uniref:type IV pilin protein n=1 Tax=Variovorax sp. J22R115 TaxID=3053509 RepID=UPI0025763197|nr:type IV pilin protein [Variovorax sp. J22R115]MDM0048635.1 type IV pilin protein [Variovorax sp. J22R115]
MKRVIPSSTRQPPAQGFTLIELMIVVAVVAILGAIAYPSYMDSVRRGWRAEARTALLQEMQQQERLYTQRASYKTGATMTKSEPGSKYDLAVAACGGTTDARLCIKLTANLKPGFSDDAVGNIWIESTGEKGCTGKDVSRCWQ